MINALLPGNPDGNAGKVSGKMDCIKKGDDTDVNAGFSQDGTDFVNFSKLYTRISNCNKGAMINDGEDLESNQLLSDQSNTEVINAADSQSMLHFQDFTGSEATNATSNSTVASELIRDALHTVTEMLGLPDRGIEKLDISEVNDATVEELAEVVYALTQIISALDETGSEDTVSQLSLESSVDNQVNAGASVENADAHISSTLRVELFKLQMGIQLLGASAEVQNKVADLAQQVSMAGMNQALDPSSISMPVEQMKKLFGNALDSINKGKSESGVPDVKSKSLQAGINIDILEEENVAVKQFDTQTYRTLLKVDDLESNGEKSGEQGANNLLEKNPMTVANTEAAIVQEGVNATRLQEFAVASDVQNIKIDVSSSHSITQEKISSALHRLSDESPVMEQITGKLTSAIRSGSNEIRIQLRPESLGEVSLRIKMEGDVVFTKIQVESQQVKQIVESNLQALKDSLAGQNLSAGLIDVSVGNDDNSGGNFDWDLHRHNDGRQKTDGVGGPDSETAQNDNVRSSRIFTGNDTGLRYGNNSIEYYA